MAAKPPKGFRQYRTWSSREREQAMKEIRRLRGSGHVVTTREVAIHGKGVMIRVFIKNQ
jgi:hypothetical protein